MRALSGSPYTIQVVDPRKVVVDDANASDDGALMLAGERAAVDVDATAAGVGELRAELRDASGAESGDVRVERVSDGRWRVVVAARRAGRYQLYLRYADHPVPSASPLALHIEKARSPSRSRIAAATKDARQE